MKRFEFHSQDIAHRAYARYRDRPHRSVYTPEASLARGFFVAFLIAVISLLAWLCTASESLIFSARDLGRAPASALLQKQRRGRNPLLGRVARSTVVDRPAGGKTGLAFHPPSPSPRRPKLCGRAF